MSVRRPALRRSTARRSAAVRHLSVVRLLAGAALVLLATTTCAQRAVDLPFTDAVGERVRVRAERRPREQAGAARAGRIAATALSPRHAVRSTARLVLAKTVPVYAGEAVTVAVRSDLAEFTVDLFSGADTVALSRTVALGGGGTIHHQIVLDTSFELWGLQLHAPAAAADGHLELTGVAVAAPAGALLVRDAELIAGSGFTPRGGARFDGTALRPVDLELAAWLFPASAASAAAAAQDGARRPAWPWLLALGLDNPGAAGAELRIHLEGDGMRRSFVVIRQAGRQLVYLHGGEIGFQPRRVLLEHAVAAAAAGVPATGLFSAAVLALPLGGAGEPPAAVPADLGTILRLDRTHWRRNDFELYEWSVPGGAEAPVLVFDTADYATQARLFRRLAFFVEKRGFRGQLLGDDELAGRRGTTRTTTPLPIWRASSAWRRNRASPSTTRNCCCARWPWRTAFCSPIPAAAGAPARERSCRSRRPRTPSCATCCCATRRCMACTSPTPRSGRPSGRRGSS